MSCKIEQSEFVSFVGPSGCGKTTLLMTIAGLLPPSGGRILVHDRPIDGPPPGLVLLFQEYNKSLFAWRSVLGNVRGGSGALPEGTEDERWSILGVDSRCEMVGARGLEPPTPTLSRWENGTFWNVPGSRFHRRNGFRLSRKRP